MSKFPDDHPIELMRGERWPSPYRVRRSMAMRAAWLVKRIHAQLVTGERDLRNNYFIDELQSIAHLMDVYERSLQIDDDVAAASVYAVLESHENIGIEMVGMPGDERDDLLRRIIAAARCETSSPGEKR